MIKNINKLFFSHIVGPISNVSTMVEDVALLEGLRQELKTVSGVEYEIKFFEETKQKASEQPYSNFIFITNSYNQEIIKKKKGN